MANSIVHQYPFEFVDDGKRDALPVYASYPAGTAWDDFNRADGPAGTTPIGQYAWQADSTDGTAKPVIASQALGVSSLGGGATVLASVAVSSDAEYTFTPRSGTGGCIPVFRAVDRQNYLILIPQGGFLAIRKRIANALSDVHTSTFASTSLSERRVKIRCKGTQVSVWVDGVLAIDAVTVADLATATRWGAYFPTAGVGRLDDVQVSPI